MSRIFKNKKGQSVVEYTMIMIIVLGAFLAMQNYLKRGIQGRWKESADNLGDQYDPRYADTSLRYVMEQNSETQIRSVPDADEQFWTFREDSTNTISYQQGYQGVVAH